MAQEQPKASECDTRVIAKQFSLDSLACILWTHRSRIRPECQHKKSQHEAMRVSWSDLNMQPAQVKRLQAFSFLFIFIPC